MKKSDHSGKIAQLTAHLLNLDNKGPSSDTPGATDRYAEEVQRLVREIVMSPAENIGDVHDKMCLANHYERFAEEAWDWSSPAVAPKMLASALADLKRLSKR